MEELTTMFEEQKQGKRLIYKYAGKEVKMKKHRRNYRNMSNYQYIYYVKDYNQKQPRTN